MRATSTVLGLVLAGGEGRRMGGVDKGLLCWRGQPMVASVAAAMVPLVSTLVISANRSSARYRGFAPVLADAPAYRGMGPLAGLQAGLEHAREEGLVAVLVCPCDTPAVTAGVLERLLDVAEQNPGRPVIALTDGRGHPLHGVYPVALLPRLEAWLGAGERRVHGFARSVGALEVDLSDCRAALRNVNRPGDLADPD